MCMTGLTRPSFKGYSLITWCHHGYETPLSMSALQSLHRHYLARPVRTCLLPLASFLTSVENEDALVKFLKFSLKHFLTFRVQSSSDGQKFLLSEKGHSRRIGFLFLIVLNQDLAKCGSVIGHLANNLELTTVPDIVYPGGKRYGCTAQIFISWVELVTPKGRFRPCRD